MRRVFKRGGGNWERTAGGGRGGGGRRGGGEKSGKLRDRAVGDKVKETR